MQPKRLYEEDTSKRDTRQTQLKKNPYAPETKRKLKVSDTPRDMSDQDLLNLQAAIQKVTGKKKIKTPTANPQYAKSGVRSYSAKGKKGTVSKTVVRD